ncbi:hypothetical protein ACS0TY_024803 [Phlomoides rotata]
MTKIKFVISLWLITLALLLSHLPFTTTAHELSISKSSIEIHTPSLEHGAQTLEECKHSKSRKMVVQIKKRLRTTIPRSTGGSHGEKKSSAIRCGQTSLLHVCFVVINFFIFFAFFSL